MQRWTAGSVAARDGGEKEKRALGGGFVVDKSDATTELTLCGDEHGGDVSLALCAMPSQRQCATVTSTPGVVSSVGGSVSVEDGGAALRMRRAARSSVSQRLSV